MVNKPRELLDNIYRINEIGYNPAVIFHNKGYFLDTLSEKDKKEIPYDIYEIILTEIKDPKDLSKILMKTHLKENPRKKVLLVMEKAFEIPEKLYSMLWALIQTRKIDNIQYEFIPIIITNKIPEFFSTRLTYFYVVNS